MHVTPLGMPQHPSHLLSLPLPNLVNQGLLNNKSQRQFASVIRASIPRLPLFMGVIINQRGLPAEKKGCCMQMSPLQQRTMAERFSGSILFALCGRGRLRDSESERGGGKERERGSVSFFMFKLAASASWRHPVFCSFSSTPPDGSL